MASRAARKPADVEVLPATNPDVEMVSTESSGIRSFLGGLIPFFTRAAELERSSKQLLVDAKALVAPKNGDEDARVQGVIKTASAAKKTVEEHWGICQVVHSLHRKL